jgi:hypothetical protein
MNTNFMIRPAMLPAVHLRQLALVALLTTACFRQAPAQTAGDCCSPEAIKKAAASASFLDIVGVKLGMTPREAAAALRAYNPNLKIDTINSRLEHPSTPGTFVRVPHFIIARTLPFDAGKGTIEAIALKFSTPPSPPVLTMMSRFTAFQQGQPVMASTLTEALRKKYGTEYQHTGERIWLYDANGKPLAGASTTAENCALAHAFPWDSQTIPDPTRDAGTINITYADDGEPQPACAAYSFVRTTGISSFIAPNSPVIQMTVTIGSGALINASLKATHDWLQAEAEGKAKQQQDATAKRAAPKM